MPNTIEYYRSITTRYFDMLTRTIESGGIIAKYPIKRPQRDEFLYHIDTCLEEIESIKQDNLNHLDTKLASRLDELQKLDEFQLKRLLFKTFCFLTPFKNLLRLMVTDVFLNEEQVLNITIILSEFYTNSGTGINSN